MVWPSMVSEYSILHLTVELRGANIAQILGSELSYCLYYYREWFFWRYCRYFVLAARCGGRDVGAYGGAFGYGRYAVSFVLNIQLKRTITKARYFRAFVF